MCVFIRLLYMPTQSTIKSVNWHITPRCNYRCRFCFAQNFHDGPVSYDKGLEILKKLADAGMTKINFAGGEPLLHPRILDYCEEAKNLGMTVSITTNGSRLNPAKIRKMSGIVDWIGLSIDSSLDTIEAELGRGTGNHVSNCLESAVYLHQAGIKLKVNTCVTALTFQENMIPIIRMLNPERWKVLQMMHIDGENDFARDLEISPGDFRYFVERHRNVLLENGTSPVFESADDMESSYFMLTPGGFVKSDAGRKVTLYSLDEVLKKGIDNFVSEMKYHERGAVYEWS